MMFQKTFSDLFVVLTGIAPGHILPLTSAMLYFDVNDSWGEAQMCWSTSNQSDDIVDYLILLPPPQTRP